MTTAPTGHSVRPSTPRPLPATADDIRRAADLIARLNRDAAQHIALFGTDAREIANALRGFSPAVDDGTLIMERGGTPFAFFGFEADDDPPQAWLYGPLVEAADEREWHACADALYEALQWFISDALPTTHEQRLFFDGANTRGIAFAERHGFALNSRDLSFDLTREGAAGSWANGLLAEAEGVFALKNEQHTAFTHLHNTLFPGTYANARQLIAEMDDEAALLVVAEEGKLLGYAAVQRQPEFGEAYLDFIGVAETVRGQQIGARLLSGALRWAFEPEDVAHLHLTVSAENTAACRLYEHAGFNRLREMVSYARLVYREP